MNNKHLVSVSKKILNFLVLIFVLFIPVLIFSGVNISRAEPAQLPAPGITCDPTVPNSCPSTTPGAKNSQPPTTTSVNTNIPAGCPGGPAGPPAPGVDCSSGGDEKINVGQQVKGTCQDIKLDGHIISDGWISVLCTGGDDQTAIESIVENLTNYVLGLGVIAFGIMLGLGMVQVMAGGASPEALKAGKKRIFLAVSSIGLFFAGRLVLDLIGVTGNHFLGVPLENFNQGTVGEIIGAIWNYIRFFGGALAVTMIITGGIRMMTAAGNPQQIQAARKTITYAIIGLLGILSVELITGLIGKMITGQ